MSRVSVAAARRLLADAAAPLSDEQVAEIINSGYALAAFVFESLQDIAGPGAAEQDSTIPAASPTVLDEESIEDQVAALVDAGIMSRWEAHRLVTQHMADAEG